MILVRHAESEWNVHYGRTRIDPGIADPPLTRAGRAQAERLVDTLAAEGVARLISSPYRRALETATIIARALDLAISVEPLVRERCAFSCDVGTPSSLLCGHWPELDSRISRSSGGAMRKRVRQASRSAARRFVPRPPICPSSRRSR
jgi:broad specificity phosphatase PhoE